MMQCFCFPQHCGIFCCQWDKWQGEKIHVHDSNLRLWSAAPRCDWLLWSFHAATLIYFCSWLPSYNGRPLPSELAVVLCELQNATKCRVNFNAYNTFGGVSLLVAVAVVEGLRILGHSGLRGQGGGQGLDDHNEQWWRTRLSDQLPSLLLLHPTTSFFCCTFNFFRFFAIKTRERLWWQTFTDQAFNTCRQKI